MTTKINNTKENKCFVASSKDLFDKKKNPNLSLSVKDTLENKEIKKFVEHFKGYSLERTK